MIWYYYDCSCSTSFSFTRTKNIYNIFFKLTNLFCLLSTTYIWFDFAHLATQDMIFSSLVTLGVFSLVKTGGKHSGLYEFCFGFWIGLAFILKTFLIIVPLLSLIPYLLSKKKLLLSKWVWIGILIGFIPFIIWTLLINQNLDKNIILYLID